MEQQIVDKIREILTDIAPNAIEREMYGGLVYEKPSTTPKRLFAGIFTRQGFVTIEFDRGAELDDPLHILEGTGKDRRHIKLTSISDITDKKIADYLLRSFKQTS